jgi:pimeloyl-ACP methyl ester carboxylesterase
MEIIIDSMIINYEALGQGQPVILMHGWGQNIEMMYSIANVLKDHYRVYNIDLPGFGQSDEPPREYTIDDYTDFLESFVKDMDIVNPIIIGHSFGCRIAIKYAARKKPVKKMVLTGAAGILDKRTLWYYTKVYTFKFFKNFKDFPFLKHYVLEAMQNSGSEDYRNSSNIMKAVLRNAVNEDLTSHLKEIDCPVLLIFGSKDEATPLWMAKIMNNNIKDSKLIVYPNYTHYAYLENANVFNKDMAQFLEEGDNNDR